MEILSKIKEKLETMKSYLHFVICGWVKKTSSLCTSMSFVLKSYKKPFAIFNHFSFLFIYYSCGKEYTQEGKDTIQIKNRITQSHGSLFRWESFYKLFIPNSHPTPAKTQLTCNRQMSFMNGTAVDSLCVLEDL